MHAKKNNYNRGGIRLANMLAKYMNGGMMYGNGGPLTKEEEEFILNNKTVKDPGFQDYLRSVNGEYYEMVIPKMDSRVERGTPGTVGFSDYERMLRDPSNRGKKLAINPSFFDMEEAQGSPGTFGKTVPNYEREGTGGFGSYEGPTYSDVMGEQVARYEKNKELERGYNEYLMKQRQPQRVGPRESVEYTPSGLTAAERRMRASFNQ